MSAVSMLTIGVPLVVTYSTLSIDGGVAIPASVTASRTVGGNTFIPSLRGRESNPTISLKIATNGTAGTFAGLASQTATKTVLAALMWRINS